MARAASKVWIAMSSSSTWSISSRKPPKCGAEEEIAMDAGRLADGAAVEEAPDAADRARDSGGSGRRHGSRPAVARRGDDGLRPSARLAASGFSVRMWQPCGSRTKRHLTSAPRAPPHRTRRRALRRRESRRARRRIGRWSSPNSAARARARVRVDIDQPDDRQAVDLARGFEPGAAHGAAADEDRFDHARLPRARRPSLCTEPLTLVS